MASKGTVVLVVAAAGAVLVIVAYAIYRTFKPVNDAAKAGTDLLKGAGQAVDDVKGAIGGAGEAIGGAFSSLQNDLAGGTRWLGERLGLKPEAARISPGTEAKTIEQLVNTPMGEPVPILQTPTTHLEFGRSRCEDLLIRYNGASRSHPALAQEIKTEAAASGCKWAQ